MNPSRHMPTMGLPASQKPAAVPAVQRYAETLATLHHLRPEPRAAYLAGLRLTAEAWDTADHAWTELLTCAGRPGDGALALAFTSAFARARRGLRLDAASGTPSTQPTETGDETMAISRVVARAVLPFVDGMVDPASFAPNLAADAPTGHETAPVPIIRPRPDLPFISRGVVPARGNR